MNRNVAILALAGSIAAGLLLLRSGMPTSSAPEESPSSPSSPVLASANDAADVIEESDAGSNAGSDAHRSEADPALASEGQVFAVAPVRREASSEKATTASRRNEPVRLVTGFVRDVQGHPVEDAIVIVTEAGSPKRPGYRGPILASGRSEEGGRFEIRTTVKPTDLEARASKVGYLESDPVPFRSGVRGLVITLDLGGVVSGRLVLDPWVTLGEVTVEIDLPSPPEGSSRIFARSRALGGSSELGPSGYMFEIDGEGRFVVTGLANSTVDLRVKAAEEPWEALCVRDVAVRRPGERGDTRLDPLDLRGLFELLAVEVLDDGGNALSGAQVTLRDSEVAKKPRSRTTPGLRDSEVAEEARSRITLNGRAEFLTRTGRHDIEIESEGFRRVHLDSVSGDQVVRLRKGIAVLVRLRGSSARPAPPDLLAVGLLREGADTMDSVVDGMGTFDDPRQATISVASPGSHLVAWYVCIGNIHAYLRTGPIVRVDIRDQEAVQELVLDLPAQAEAAWIDRQQSLEGSRPEGESKPR